jgi:hypothetical protein
MEKLHYFLIKKLIIILKLGVRYERKKMDSMELV